MSEPDYSKRVRRPSDEWISDELIAETKRVWLAEYGRAVCDGEAIEILANFKRLAEVLLRAKADKARAQAGT